jgi:hypothetical protein
MTLTFTCESCGFQGKEGDAFCGNCGKPRPRAGSPRPAEPEPADYRVPAPPLTLTRPAVSQPGMPSGLARGDGGGTLGRHRDAGTSMMQSLEPVSPSQSDADSVYLSKTLRHEPMELALDDSVSLRTLGIMLVRAYLFSGIVFFLLGIFGIYSAVNGGGGTFLIIAFVVGIITFWIVLLATKTTEPIGEWRALLTDRAGQAGAYYNTIRAVIERRQLPIANPQYRQTELAVPGRPVKHTIVLAESEYQTYVTVFPYGTSLYVGWQMWRQRAGGQLIKRALVDRASGANLVIAMQRTDRARAVREAVHLACREAVYAAVDQETQAYAQQLRLPDAEQESALALPHTASPALPPSSAGLAPPSYTPAPSLPPQAAAPMDMPHE